jgi:hypothetical protein
MLGRNRFDISYYLKPFFVSGTLLLKRTQSLKLMGKDFSP